MNTVNFSILDKLILHVDNILRGNGPAANYPAKNIADLQSLTNAEKQDSISMMRINHSGEICAQALYYGQALMARTTEQYTSLLYAANQENEHLQWCRQRLTELNARTSLLNPFWYAGSFAIGVVFGAAGDKISLGFLAETEHQVTAHLEKHLRNMPIHDQRSRCIIAQMRQDELQHATYAVDAGGVKLPKFVQFLMQCTAKVLTFTAAKI